MKLIAALMLAAVLPATGAPAVSAREMADQQEKIGLFLKWGVPAEDIGHNLALWYGRAFVTECERGTDVCDVYLVIYKWDNSVLAAVIAERVLISSIVGARK